MHTAFGGARQALAFSSGVQADSGRSLRVPVNTGEAPGALHSARPWDRGPPGWTVPALYPTTPATGNATTSWRKTVADCPFSWDLFLCVKAFEPCSNTRAAPGTHGQGTAVALASGSQERPAFFPDCFLTLESAPLP